MMTFSILIGIGVTVVFLVGQLFKAMKTVEL